MKSNWRIYGKKADFEQISRTWQIDPVIARIMRNREIVGEAAVKAYLTGGLEELHPARLLKDGDKLAKLLLDKIQEQKHVRIVGDYDIDGICAVYILYTALTALGASADYVIPHRIGDGYGINERIVDEAAADGVDTLLTCDNGITAFAPMKKAKQYGLTVLITDHHEPVEERGIILLPQADAIVNPHQPGCTYPCKDICGAVVAMKIAGLLFEKAGGDSSAWQEEAYEFAAVATVGDVMSLQGENRILVKEGLKRIHHTHNPGLRELIEQWGLQPAEITAYHIGFQIGPCLNASGRLETAVKALELLLEKDEVRAKALAAELKNLNDRRKEMTLRWCEQALLQAQKEAEKNRVLVLYLPDCHESLAGIIAGRVREALYRPVYVLTRSEKGVKGSGRSIPGYSMFHGLLECQDLLVQFGGHVMAAGVSLEEKNINAFRSRLNENCTLTEKELVPVKWIDAPMPMHYVSRELVRQLKLLEPFGKGNEKPLFAQNSLTVRRAAMAGGKRDVMKLSLEDAFGKVFSCVKFHEEESNLPGVGTKVACTYYPSVNTYRGEESLEFILDEILSM